MKSTIRLTQNFVKGILSVYFLALSSLLLASSESEVITTIILINRQAELVDVSLEGEVLKRHVAVPDYFSSGRTHSNSLKRSLKLIKTYGSTNHVLPGSSDLCSQSLQSYLLRQTQTKSTCKLAKDEKSHKWKNPFIKVRGDKGNAEVFSFGLIKPNIKKKKMSKEAMIPKDSIAFADVFFPLVQRVSSYRRQHKISKERYHRGVFLDT